MKKLSLNEIREAFLSFYQSKGHFRRQSYPLIPQSDKSLLLINAGMAPLKPYFSGIENPPASRMTTCQKCIRTADIENVGITSRHGTFFEMLGTFSFGDYFKRESITWGWEFVTEYLKMPVENLWASVHEEDSEAYEIWRNEIGIPEKHIVKLSKKDNFWEIGQGPCGPCSELYFDRGKEYGCADPDCKPGCDCDRYVEFWNHVFTQFNNDGNGNYTELSQKNIDTGMGLERVACIMQGTDSIFDIDTIRHILQEVENKTNVKYENGTNPSDVSIRIITDHLRAAVFMIGDKIMPGNEGRGYVLRRLIRRAVRHGRKLGVMDAFLSELIDAVVDVSGDAYPEIKQQQEFIKKIIDVEEKQFALTLEQGMSIISEYIDDMNREDEIALNGEKAFKLHDTYGFPIDITEEILKEHGFGVDRNGFEECMEKQKNAGKANAAETDAAWEESPVARLKADKTVFTGYEKYADESKVIAIIHDNDETVTAGEGEDVIIVLDETPFYAESGGQLSDTGSMTSEGFNGRVVAVENIEGIYLHKVRIIAGKVKKNQTLQCAVDISKRNCSARNHTATHLLHSALREVLGTHVQQAGSSVSTDGLRFDFNHFKGLKASEINDVEELVNAKINEFLPVTTEEMSQKEAEQAGAIGIFEDKYGETVRVVNVDGYSIELCGGIHVSNSGQIGSFKILNESGIASGVRRIEAVTGTGVLELLKKDEEIIDSVSKKLKAVPNQITDKLNAILSETKEMKKELESFKDKALDSASDDIVKKAKEINGIKLITKTFNNYEIGDLRKISDDIKSKYDKTMMVLAANNGGKVTFMVSLTGDLVERGHHAGKMIKKIAAAADGNGGGKPDIAQAGAKDSSKINEAFAVAETLI